MMLAVFPDNQPAVACHRKKRIMSHYTQH